MGRVGGVKILLVGCKNSVEGTLKGGDLVFFLVDRAEYHPNPPIMENTVLPKFSKPVGMLDSFTKYFSRKTLSFEFVFCLVVQDYDSNLQNKFGYRWLLQFSPVVCPLKLSLCFYTFPNIF